MARDRDPNPRWQQKNQTTRSDTKPTLRIVKKDTPKPPPSGKGKGK